jgi:hypothetical protein
MTRTTLKALWFGGGGILATWLAVSPEHAVPSASQASAVQQQAAVAQPAAEQLNAQAVRLRERAAEVALRPSTRNPFRYSSRKPAAEAPTPRDREQQPGPVEPPMAATPPLPALKLSGIARKAEKRTAIVTIDGQIYLVSDGDAFAGRYTVVKVDPETVLIRDADGVEQRLVLP